MIDKKKRLDDHYEAKSIKQNVQKAKYDKIVAGDEVKKVLSYGQKGEVLEIVNDEEAIAQMGIIKMKLPIEDLEKNKRKVKPTKMVTRQNRQTIKTELDLRGYRYEDALIELGSIFRSGRFK